MENIYAFSEKKEFDKYKETISSLNNVVHNYKQVLEKDYALRKSPRGIVWTTPNHATTIFSKNPIPAFTRDNVIFFSPDEEKWREIFHEQLGNHSLPWIDDYYKENLFNQLADVLCHELTHHIDLFPGEFEDYYDSDIWFEEGMAFYIPRKILLTKEKFRQIIKVERTIAKSLNVEYGGHSILEFGEETYSSSIASIMFDYFRSFLLVNYLTDGLFQGDEKAFLREYNHYFPNRSELSFEQYFQVSLSEIWIEILKTKD
ncbi:hypothetical protein [Enterococcus massiliensis]|uniref:hypothetical protein n=1 Tax=Enterococcus massiliensis TaxID=1640685 RepID=UPI00065E422E|nr:hypothetical protein [Enterococcus massiliensis]